ncbi:MAG TPA: helical backbone metal receptor [Candidatus Lustribacter sp.]|nr:helical backbone metal receptor [Candidatus Lustribacter sp.]
MTSAAFPVTVTAANGQVTITAAPKKIVSLSPTATEMLFALGAGAQVIAVDDQSTYPATAPKTKLSGFQPNAEAVAAYAPDLVVFSNDANGLKAALTKLTIPVLELPAAATLEESYVQEATLGTATGHDKEATALVATTKARLAAAVASVPRTTRAPKVYHELDPTYFSVTSKTFIGNLYTTLGLVSIADGAGDTSGGYPKLSAEFVITSAPDLVVLADSKCCGQNEASFAKRPGFASLPAVLNGDVVAADDDIASRWGPRVADLAEAVAKEMATP